MQESDNTTLFVDPDSNPVRKLTPEKARSLLEMFSSMAQRYNPAPLFEPRRAQRLVTAQRPFYERYQWKPHSGAKEMARRVRQMNRRGHCPDLLTESVDGTFWTTDSHGTLCPFYS